MATGHTLDVISHQSEAGRTGRETAAPRAPRGWGGGGETGALAAVGGRGRSRSCSGKQPGRSPHGHNRVTP